MRHISNQQVTHSVSDNHYVIYEFCIILCLQFVRAHKFIYYTEFLVKNMQPPCPPLVVGRSVAKGGVFRWSHLTVFVQVTPTFIGPRTSMSSGETGKIISIFRIRIAKYLNNYGHRLHYINLMCGPSKYLIFDKKGKTHKLLINRENGDRNLGYNLVA